MMQTIYRIALSLSAFALAFGCTFPNDMSYPVVLAEITAFDVEGAESVSIDAESRTISVVLDETCNIAALEVTTFKYTDGAQLVGGVPSVIDLSTPKTFVLKTYQEYEWTVYATQPVERYIRVDNQASEPELNLSTRIAVVYVLESQDLKNVTFREMKLEKDGAQLISTTGFELVAGESVEVTEPVSLPMTLNCMMLRYFDFKVNDEDVRWTIKVVQEKVELKVSSINAWAKHAQVYGLFDGDGAPVIEYKKVSDAEWTVCNDAVVAGVGISADITGLESATEYEVRIGKDGNYSAVASFTTEEALQLYNCSFDNWSLDGKVWYPYPSGASQDQMIWDSANKGAATFIGSSTTPDEVMAVSGTSARMESKYAVIAFAAGNLYTGKFDKIAGVGAELDWGVPFASRPTSLSGYYRYDPKPIDKVKPPYENILGEMDKCQIQVILTDWDKPFHINTTAGKFVDIAGDPAIIAHAVMETDIKTDGFVEFTMPLEYRDLERKPTYVVISACASYLGDYFTGGVGSTLYVDEFEFIYE